MQYNASPQNGKIEVNENEQFWQKDEDASSCTKCEKSFTFSTRRHHCRACGRIFCSDCSSHRSELPSSFKRKGKQRVCDDCYFYIIDLNTKKMPAQKPDYDQSRKEVLQQVEHILSVEESKWKLTRESRGVTIWKLALPSSNIYCFRTTVVIDQPTGPVWKIYMNDSLWRNWQPDLTCRTIEVLPDTSSVMYLTYRFPIIENRDSCLYSFYKQGTFTHPDKERAYSLYSRTISHPKCPPSSNHVRCYCSVSYTSVEPVDSHGKEFTRITSYLHLDPKGLIPAVFVNSVLSNAVNAIVIMKKWMESHAHEYSQPSS